MGLAAGQARLLTITARKSDCEFQSMRLSHQKLAIARDMTDISNEYQSSLNKTKLLYDFYGNGSTDQLSYNTLMYPSALNDYTPKMITDPQGKAVLDAKYAAAAKAAGIPQEGIGGLPSDNVRNKFVQGLEGQGIISSELSKIIQTSKYNQAAGVGSTETITVTTTEGNINVLKKMMEDMTGTISLQGLNVASGSAEFQKDKNTITNPNGITLHDLFTNQYSILGVSKDGQHYPEDQIKGINTYISATFIPQMADQFAELLDTGNPYVKEALAYAESQTLAMYDPNLPISETGTSVKRVKKKGLGTMIGYVQDKEEDYAGTVYASYYKGGLIGRKYNSTCAVNLSNIADIFLTNYAKYMEGVAKSNNYHVEKGQMNGAGQNIVTNDPSYIYIINTGSSISASDMKIANFYDTLFNQLCTKGWLENDNVSDNSYLQDMLQGGMMYVTSLKDDGYYYQGNYSTDTYIKEVSDDAAIAQAEAKYNTEKSKLNQKEQTLDLKMKNLDTEISSLTTEYDTVKSVVSKNIEKAFKRYNA